jgi:hypothetical protein
VVTAAPSGQTPAVATGIASSFFSPFGGEAVPNSKGTAMSTITILTASPKVPQVKTITVVEDGTDIQQKEKTKLSIQGAKMSKHFSSTEQSVSSLATLAKVLEKLQKDPFSFVVRGCVIDGVDRQRHVRRKAKSEDGTIADVDQQWVCLDLDKKPLAGLGLTPEDLQNNPTKVVKALTADLPTCFSSADCFWHFTSSTGITDQDLVSVHLWYWLDQPMSNNDLRAYFETYNQHIEQLFGVSGWVDTVTFDSIQPHFTADPQLVGMEDPIPQRSGILKGKKNKVKISEDWISVTPLDQHERWRDYLMKIGEDKDGFHQPLLSASASWVRKNGYSESANKEFVEIAREFIDNADPGERSRDEINRYRSDTFLGQLLKTASEKGFDLGGPIVSEGAADYFRNHVYVAPLDKFYAKDTNNFIPKGAFNLVGRKYGLASAGANIFVESNGSIVDKVACLPGEEIGGIVTENGEITYNSWPGRICQPEKPANGQFLQDHVLYICGDDEKAANTILDYMAHIIQHPGKKIMWCPLIGSSTQGVGKSILKELYYNILGPKMIEEIGIDSLESDFNQYMYNTELIFIEEIHTNNRKRTTDKLKTMITEKRIDVNIKNISGFNAPNTANLFLFTNHENALYLEDGDRRFYPVYTNIKIKEPEYYKKLARYFRNETPGIMQWLMDRDLSNFDRNRAPEFTESKRKAIAFSTSAWKTDLQEALEGHSWPLQHDVMTGNELTDALKDLVGKRMASQHVFSYLQDKLGFVKYKEGVRIRLPDGTRPFIWVCRDHEKYLSMENHEIIEFIKPIGSLSEWRTSRSY